MGRTLTRMFAALAVVGIAAWWACIARVPADEHPAGHDTEIVRARARVIGVAASTLRGGDDFPFERHRDLINALGYTRTSDAQAVAIVLRHLGTAAPSAEGEFFTVYGHVIREYVAPAPPALARIGLPAVASLLDTIGSGEATAGQGEKAEEALRTVLGRQATLWLAGRADETEVGSTARQRLDEALERAGTWEPLNAHDERMLWGMISMTAPGDVPPAPPADLASGLASDDAGVRYVTVAKIRGQRQRETWALAAVVADTELPAEDRAKAATTLGWIRAVSYDAGEGEALLSLLAGEQLTPDMPVTGTDAPAAMALVRIGVPMAPMLCRTICAADDEQLRSNCAGVLATMLGRYGRPWLEGVRDTADGQKQKRRVAAELKRWNSCFEGEGYWATQAAEESG